MDETSISADRRVCVDCGQEKTIGEFPIKSAKNESEIRWDKCCKLCKAQAAKERRKKTKCEIIHDEIRPKRIIEPKEEVSNGSDPRLHETNMLVNRIDFTDLERSCGKKLSHAERYEAVQRFNEFISILREGYSDLVGCEVYVRKD